MNSFCLDVSWQNALEVVEIRGGMTKEETIATENESTVLRKPWDPLALKPFAYPREPANTVAFLLTHEIERHYLILAAVLK